MNATMEVDRLLEQSGAVLVRHKKHLVYRLPNGNNFVAAKTTSDPARAAKNNLSTLRNALGVPREESERPKEDTMQQQCPARLSPLESPAPLPEAKESLKQRIEAAIADEEVMQEKLLVEASAHERKVHMLKALLPFAEDPATEGSLRNVLPEIQPPEPPPPALPIPEPPQQITNRVQVTRQLVFAATQTFDETFTVNDVVERMTGSAHIDLSERQRIRSSVAQAMATLFERGEVLKKEQGIGRQQSIWRKVSLNGNGGGGVGTRA
jgi:hypothetical protein